MIYIIMIDLSIAQRIILPKIDSPKVTSSQRFYYIII